MITISDPILFGNLQAILKHSDNLPYEERERALYLGLFEHNGKPKIDIPKIKLYGVLINNNSFIFVDNNERDGKSFKITT